MPFTYKHKKKMSHKKPEKDQYADRLAKRLCYILRYGAIKEGLAVHEGGFIDVKEVMTVSMMRHHSEQDVLDEVEKSTSHRNTKRFDRKDENGKIFIRANFCRNFEPSPYHEGTKVTTLLQSCIHFVAGNLQEYDLEDFPDEFVINAMFSYLKRKKKLNSSNLRQLLVPVIEHLDFDSVYITDGILKTVCNNCPNLRVLILKDCGYVVTDSVVEMLFRKLPYLESVSLAACKHVTDKSLVAMGKYGHSLKELNLSWITNLSGSAILKLLEECDNLQLLDIYDHRVSPETMVQIVEIARLRGIKVVLKGVTDNEVALENPSMLLPNFGKVW